MASHAWQIRKTIGNLHIINARTEGNSPLMQDIKARGFDLDEGMVIKYGDNYYHSADALHIMAILGTDKGWFNRINALLFSSKTLATICYPAMRMVRNLALLIKGVPKIRNLETTHEQ